MTRRIRRSRSCRLFPALQSADRLRRSRSLRDSCGAGRGFRGDATRRFGDETDFFEWLEYRVYDIGDDGHIVKSTPLICRDDPKPSRRPKGSRGRTHHRDLERRAFRHTSRRPRQLRQHRPAGRNGLHDFPEVEAEVDADRLALMTAIVDTRPSAGAMLEVEGDRRLAVQPAASRHRVRRGRDELCAVAFAFEAAPRIEVEKRVRSRVRHASSQSTTTAIRSKSRAFGVLCWREGWLPASWRG